MTDLVLTPLAEHDAAIAKEWYDEQQLGLGDEFVDELRSALGRIREGPLRYQIVFRDLRRLLLARFPYSVFYLVQPERTVVLGVLHQARSPSAWRDL